jgi:hypothetical protein
MPLLESNFCVSCIIVFYLLLIGSCVIQLFKERGTVEFASALNYIGDLLVGVPLHLELPQFSAK